MILYTVEETDDRGKTRRITCLWYSPGEIIFNYDQNLWLIEYILPLDYGEWYPEPIETGESQQSQKKWAYFEAACCVMAEFRERLKKLPKKALKTLIDETWAGAPNFKALSIDAMMPLDYISGKEPRKQTYNRYFSQTIKRMEIKMQQTASKGLTSIDIHDRKVI